MRYIKMYAVLLLCLLLCSCSKNKDNNVSTSQKTDTPKNTTTDSITATLPEPQSQNITTNIVNEPTTENHELSYYEEMTFDNEETIEYKEVYNDKDIIINTINYLHDDNDCYVEFRIDNNTDKDIVVKELTYSLNFSMYSKGSSVEELPQIIVQSNKSNTVKCDVKTTYDGMGYKNITDLMFLISLYDKETENIIDTPLIEIQTSKYDGYARFIDYPVTKSTENFDYSFYDDKSYINKGYYYVFIYNKTGNIYKKKTTDVYFNDYSAKEDSEAFYNSGFLESFSDGNYCIFDNNDYILPYCKGDYEILLHDKNFVKKTNSDTVNSIDSMVEYYSINDDLEPQIKENIKIIIE